MSDERADLILNMLRSIRAKQDQHDQKFDEVITRLSALERDFAGMKLDFAGVHARLGGASIGSSADSSSSTNPPPDQQMPVAISSRSSARGLFVIE